MKALPRIIDYLGDTELETSLWPDGLQSFEPKLKHLSKAVRANVLTAESCTDGSLFITSDIGVIVLLPNHLMLKIGSRVKLKQSETNIWTVTSISFDDRLELAKLKVELLCIEESINIYTSDLNTIIGDLEDIQADFGTHSSEG
jgi:hypothetical protein